MPSSARLCSAELCPRVHTEHGHNRDQWSYRWGSQMNYDTTGLPSPSIRRPTKIKARSARACMVTWCKNCSCNGFRGEPLDVILGCNAGLVVGWLIMVLLVVIESKRRRKICMLLLTWAEPSREALVELSIRSRTIVKNFCLSFRILRYIIIINTRSLGIH